MKKKMKHFLGFVGVLLAVVLMTVPVSAAPILMTQTFFWPTADLGKTIGEYPYGISNPSQIKVSSSNPKVMSVLKPRKTTKKKDGDIAKYYKVVYELKINKYGTVTVTSTEKMDSGETNTYKTTYYIKKYSNALSSLKIGSKQYSSKFAKRPTYEIAKKNISGKKFTIKVKKGWKISEINYINADGTKVVKLKNGFKRSFKKGETIAFTLKNSKGEFLGYSIVVK